WPGLRLRLPDEIAQIEPPAEPAVVELIAASATPSETPPAATAPDEALDDVAPEQLAQQPPLLRAPHDFEPVALEPADTAEVVPDNVSAPADSNTTLPTRPPPDELPTVPFALGGIGLAALMGVALGARQLRRLRPVPHEP